METSDAEIRAAPRERGLTLTRKSVTDKTGMQPMPPCAGGQTAGTALSLAAAHPGAEKPASDKVAETVGDNATLVRVTAIRLMAQRRPRSTNDHTRSASPDG